MHSNIVEKKQITWIFWIYIFSLLVYSGKIFYDSKYNVGFLIIVLLYLLCAIVFERYFETSKYLLIREVILIVLGASLIYFIGYVASGNWLIVSESLYYLYSMLYVKNRIETRDCFKEYFNVIYVLLTIITMGLMVYKYNNKVFILLFSIYAVCIILDMFIYYKKNEVNSWVWLISLVILIVTSFMMREIFFYVLTILQISYLEVRTVIRKEIED